MRHYVLDAFAVMAFLNDEPGKEKVKELLEKALQNEVKLHMHAVNLIEVYYTVYREDGPIKADAVYLTLKALPISLVTLNLNDVTAVGKIKGSYPLSLADAFAASLTQSLNGILVTGDAEFRKLDDVIDIEWLE